MKEHFGLDERGFKLLAQDHIEKWGCSQDGEWFFTHSSLLCPVVRDNKRLMLKIVDPNDDEAHGAEILNFYDGYGAVRVIENNENIQLLERATDTTGQQSLENMSLNGQDDEATGVICDVIDQLHSKSGEQHLPSTLIPFIKRIEGMKANMDEGRVSEKELPAFEVAYSLSDELTQSTIDTQMLLHGDIHHFNILYSDERGWLAIDPKGFYGPRVYEYAAPLCNPCEHEGLVADNKRMDRQASIMSERSKIDKGLILKFTFAHAMQVAAWCLHEPSQKYWKSVSMTAANLAGINLPTLELHF